MEDFKEQVKKSFLACKADINTIDLENQNLKEKISNLENKNQNLEKNLNNTNSKLIELTAQIKGFEIALNYIKDINSKVQQENIKEKKNKIITKAIPETKDQYEALLAFKAKANKREILKQKILAMIGETGLNLSELKFLFVEHYKYCSKATFYNYLKELEYEKQVITKKEQHKNFIYLLNSINNQI